MVNNEKFRRKDIGIYKANKKTTGSVAQFKMGNLNDCMFLELAKQTGDMDGEAPYDWQNSKISVKLGLPDITKMLAYFRSGGVEPLKLFHQTEKGSKAIELSWQEKYNTFYLKVSSKEKKKSEDGKENEELKSVAVPIGLDEVELLRVGFNRAIELILGW